jgi:hypothetical protein
MDDVVLGAFRPELSPLSLLFVAGDWEGLLKEKARLKKAFENDRPLRFFTVMERERQ